jgi:PPOX class probable F420-dependent enzyme
VLEGPALAHLVTLDPDGRPQVSIVWIGVDGDELVAAHLPEHRKVRNIRRDPRVALSVEAGTRNEIGLDEYIVIHGSARITEGGAAALLQQLARVYLGPEVKFPPMDEPPAGFVTHISVERVGAWRESAAWIRGLAEVGPSASRIQLTPPLCCDRAPLSRVIRSRRRPSSSASTGAGDCVATRGVRPPEGSECHATCAVARS